MTKSLIFSILYPFQPSSSAKAAEMLQQVSSSLGSFTFGADMPPIGKCLFMKGFKILNTSRFKYKCLKYKLELKNKIYFYLRTNKTIVAVFCFI